MTAGQPEQSVQREITAYEVKPVRRATTLLAPDFHLAVEEVAEIGGHAGSAQIGSDVAIQLGEFIRVRSFLLDLVVHEASLLRDSTLRPSRVFESDAADTSSHQCNLVK